MTGDQMFSVCVMVIAGMFALAGVWFGGRLK